MEKVNQLIKAIKDHYIGETEKNLPLITTLSAIKRYLPDTSQEELVRLLNSMKGVKLMGEGLDSKVEIPYSYFK
jgi:hypothetical protein